MTFVFSWVSNSVVTFVFYLTLRNVDARPNKVKLIHFLAKTYVYCPPLSRDVKNGVYFHVRQSIMGKWTPTIDVITLPFLTFYSLILISIYASQILLWNFVCLFVVYSFIIYISVFWINSKILFIANYLWKIVISYFYSKFFKKMSNHTKPFCRTLNFASCIIFRLSFASNL